MWALIVDGKINRIFKTPIAFKHPTTGIQYPRNWLSLASDSEKTSVGFIEVTYSGTYKNADYYNNSESSPVYNASAGTVVITKSSSAKNLASMKVSKKQQASTSEYSCSLVFASTIIIFLSLICLSQFLRINFSAKSKPLSK